MRKYYSIMIKPASSLCNLRCKYCFYANVSDLREVKSYGIMPYDLMEKMLSNIYDELDDNAQIDIAFQGGEPTLASLEWFKHFTDIIDKWEKKIIVNYALQTNGILIDDDWAKFFYDHKVLVGLSLDMIKDLHDNVRVDVNGKGTYNNLIKTVNILNKYHVEYNVLCTLTNNVARYPVKVYNELKKLNIRFVQFTPCLDELDKPHASVYALTPKRFASFYKTIFDLWYQDFCHNNYYSIKLIDDIVNLLAYNRQTACGILGKCQAQLVVEANGMVYPCDFYCLDDHCLGNILDHSLNELYLASFNHPSKEVIPLPKHCENCKFLKMCHGNCKRMRSEICLDMDDNYCGYEDFLNYSINRLMNIANEQVRFRNASMK